MTPRRASRRPVVVIGDCLLDEVQGESVESVPGGGALNVSVALVRLGVPSALVATIGRDENGTRLVEYIRASGVRLALAPEADQTGVATSFRVNGKPKYLFNEAMTHRVVPLGAAVVPHVAHAPCVVISSFPFDDEVQVDDLLTVLSHASGMVVLDPNPRAALIRGPAAYTANVERVARFSDIVKVSTDDVDLLYSRSVDRPGRGETGPQVAQALGRRLAGDRTQAIVLTRGGEGAEILTAGGTSIVETAPSLPGPVLDTTGAGDVALAALVAFLLRGHGSVKSLDDAGWRACLEFAMLEAGRRCREVGFRFS